MRERIVPIEAKTLQVLEARHSRTPASEFVFGDTPAALLKRVARQLRGIGNKIGAGAVSVRVLRHTFFCRLVHAGADPLTLITIAGWKSTFLPIKSFINPIHQRERVARSLMQVVEPL